MTAGRRGAALVDAPTTALTGATLTAGRRGAELVDAPTATMGAWASVVRRGRALVLDTDANMRFDPCLLDSMVLPFDGGTVLLFVWREWFDWGGLI